MMEHNFVTQLGSIGDFLNFSRRLLQLREDASPSHQPEFNVAFLRKKSLRMKIPLQYSAPFLGEIFKAYLLRLLSIE
jgi:hypothetical protein